MIAMLLTREGFVKSMEVDAKHPQIRIPMHPESTRVLQRLELENSHTPRLTTFYYAFELVSIDNRGILFYHEV